LIVNNFRITTSKSESVAISYATKVDGVQGSSIKPESPRIGRKTMADSPRIGRKSAADSPRISRKANADSPRLHRKSNITMSSMMVIDFFFDIFNRFNAILELVT